MSVLYWAGEMAQRVKAAAAKPDDPSTILRTYTGREGVGAEGPLCSTSAPWHVCPHTYTQHTNLNASTHYLFSFITVEVCARWGRKFCEQRTVLRNGFSPPSIRWVPEIELRQPCLPCWHRYLLSCLTVHVRVFKQITKLSI